MEEHKTTMEETVVDGKVIDERRDDPLEIVDDIGKDEICGKGHRDDNTGHDKATTGVLEYLLRKGLISRHMYEALKRLRDGENGNDQTDGPGYRKEELDTLSTENLDAYLKEGTITRAQYDEIMKLREKLLKEIRERDGKNDQTDSAPKQIVDDIGKDEICGKGRRDDNTGHDKATTGVLEYLLRKGLISRHMYEALISILFSINIPTHRWKRK